MNKKIIWSACCMFFLAGCQKPSSQSGISSIKDAVSKSIGLECVYTDPENNQQTKIYIKNTTIGLESRSDATGEKNLHGLIKDNKFYMWNSATKTGSVASLEKMSAGGTMKVAGKVVTSNDDIINAMEPYQKDCKIITDDTIFELPQGISFKE